MTARYLPSDPIFFLFRFWGEGEDEDAVSPFQLSALRASLCRLSAAFPRPLNHVQRGAWWILVACACIAFTDVCVGADAEWGTEHEIRPCFAEFISARPATGLRFLGCYNVAGELTVEAPFLARSQS